MTTYSFAQIKSIIGLGNPGPKFVKTRHNIGFRVVDTLAASYGVSWSHGPELDWASIPTEHGQVLLVKPLTFMNTSGKVLPWLTKKGIKPDQIIVVHDELEKEYGKIVINFSGSHKGHNGLRSIIGAVGADFWRCKFGISRPQNKEDVPDYVLAPFTGAEESVIDSLIEQAVEKIRAGA